MALKSFSQAPADSKPEACRYVPDRIRRLEEIFSGLLESKKAQSAGYALMRDGKIFAHKFMGPRHYALDEPYQPHNWRKIASITKVITSLAILKLVEDGRLLLEFPLANVLPEFSGPDNSDLRIIHLLTHTSGLPADPGYFCEKNTNMRIWEIFDEADWVEGISSLPRNSSPGLEWAYCSMGFALLGEIVRRVTGESWTSWIEREILTPAGLRDTFFRIDDRPKDKFCFVSEQEEQKWEKIKAHPDYPLGAAGHAFSTPADLMALGKLFLEEGTVNGRRIVGYRTIKAMCSVHVTVPAFHWGDKFPDMSYGLGVSPARHPLLVPETVWGHEGASRAAWWFDPASSFCAAWLLPTTLDWDPDFCWTPRAVVWSGLCNR